MWECDPPERSSIFSLTLFSRHCAPVSVTSLRPAAIPISVTGYFFACSSVTASIPVLVFPHSRVSLLFPIPQSLIGDVDNAMRTFLNYYTVWKQFGGLPEFYNIPQGYTVDKREGYPLRPGKQTWN